MTGDDTRSAAEKGDSDAQYALGMRFLEGEGVPVDYEQAACTSRRCRSGRCCRAWT